MPYLAAAAARPGGTGSDPGRPQPLPYQAARLSVTIRTANRDGGGFAGSGTVPRSAAALHAVSCCLRSCAIVAACTFAVAACALACACSCPVVAACRAEALLAYRTLATTDATPTASIATAMITKFSSLRRLTPGAWSLAIRSLRQRRG